MRTTLCLPLQKCNEQLKEYSRCCTSWWFHGFFGYVTWCQPQAKRGVLDQAWLSRPAVPRTPPAESLLVSLRRAVSWVVNAAFHPLACPHPTRKRMRTRARTTTEKEETKQLATWERAHTHTHTHTFLFHRDREKEGEVGVEAPVPIDGEFCLAGMAAFRSFHSRVLFSLFLFFGFSFRTLL